MHKLLIAHLIRKWRNLTRFVYKYKLLTDLLREDMSLMYNRFEVRNVRFVVRRAHHLQWAALNHRGAYLSQ